MTTQGRFRLQEAVMVLALAATAGTAVEPTTLKLATTTSTENSGLLAHLLPLFEKETGIRIHVIAVGSGAALKLGENGDVDVVLSHSPEAEQAFVAKGYARERRPVMYNEFVVVGPTSDPARVAGRTNAVACFQRIAAAGSAFVSRGDASGTHVKERALWKAAGLVPPGNRWYLEAGQGMEAVLVMASEKGAYTLTDRGTLLAIGDKAQLSIVCEGDPSLFNQYGVLAVNPDKFPLVKSKEADKFVDWLTSAVGQQAIADFRKNGRQLFFPLKAPKETGGAASSPTEKEPTPLCPKGRLTGR